MNIQGLQAVSLLDVPGHVAATVFLGGCDFRCGYCHNAELLDARAQALMGMEALFSFLKERRGFLDAVCITGGEPLLHQDLEDLIRPIRALGYFIKLDTNGTHPRCLSDLLQKGLVDYVAMDIKNAKDRYAETAGVPVAIDAIEESVRLLMEQAPVYEFRTTVTQKLHDDAAMAGIASWIAGADQYFIQPFRMAPHVPDPSLGTPDPATLQRYLSLFQGRVGRAEIRAFEEN